MHVFYLIKLLLKCTFFRVKFLAKNFHFPTYQNHFKEGFIIENDLLKPKNEFVFYSLFKKGNEDMTKDFIESILEREIKKIEIISDENLLKKVAQGNFETSGLEVILDDDTICNIKIEMFNHHDIGRRALFYWARLYKNHVIEHSHGKKITKAITILILHYEVERFEDENYITKWKIIEDENRETVLTDDFELYIIELPKAMSTIRQNN